MGYRTDNFGRGQALENDKTTTGAGVLRLLRTAPNLDAEFSG